jgi:signal transduction histidine kinase
MEALNKPDGFDAEDERLFVALASLVASVVGNANVVSARQELEQLRESLTHMIVHDLRSPAGTIANTLDILGRSIQNGEIKQAEHLIGIATRANRRILNLVDSLLDISRLEAGQRLSDRQPVSLSMLIHSALEQLELYVKRKRIDVDVWVPDRLPFVNADAGMLERVLLNLIGNALKFTPTGGEVDISIERVDMSILVRVRDSGPGIPAEKRRLIFSKDAYLKGREAVSGIGLGLVFCRLAVEAHGGRIWLEQVPEGGSSFVFSLPLDAEL